jgi:hypothetical protein
MTDDRLPCETATPNATTAAAMQEARQGGIPSFNSVCDLLDHLDSDD